MTAGGTRSSTVTDRFHVEGIEKAPVHLVSSEDPSDFSMAELISGIPLRGLLARVTAPEKLCLVDYAWRPGHTRLTLLT